MPEPMAPSPHMLALLKLEHFETSLGPRAPRIRELARVPQETLVNQTIEDPAATVALLVELITYFDLSQTIRDALPETA